MAHPRHAAKKARDRVDGLRSFHPIRRHGENTSGSDAVQYGICRRYAATGGGYVWRELVRWLSRPCDESALVHCIAVTGRWLDDLSSDSMYR